MASSFNKQEDFNRLVELAMKEQNYAYMRPVIEKELLHYDILFALDKQGLLDKLTFQGGTSLRLCYGSQRFSEDLDFAGGYGFVTADLLEMKNCLENYIAQRYGLDISVKEPAEMQDDNRSEGLKVDKWQIAITTAPTQKDLPKQRIKIEVCNIPAYTRTPLSLNANYDFLPDGYGDILILTESLEEIMADKLIAFVNNTKYVRNRDIWDLRWLRQRGAEINKTLIFAKIKDYKITDYQEKLDKMLSRLNSIIQGEDFKNELTRFIPLNVQERTLNKDKFKEFLLNETQELLTEVKNLFGDSVKPDEFLI